MTITPFWLYRAGRNRVDFNGHRALFSETWLSTQPELSIGNTIANMAFCTGIWANPFAGAADLIYTNWIGFVERLWPQPGWVSGLVTTPASTHAQELNPNAPEAAFRLQRVGATGAPAPGRVMIPILTDRYYLDVPQRRHVDATFLNAQLTLGINNLPHAVTSGGRTYTNVLFRRSTMEWWPLHHYHMLPNPCRVWQRWRPYIVGGSPTPDSLFVPPELVV